MEEQFDSVYDAPNVAMIPPVPEIHWSTPMTFHLCEAPIVLSSEKYAQYYKWHTDRGHYLIIDNGAAVGGTVSNADLVKAAKMVNADEIVVPDAMADPARSLKWAKRFIQLHAGVAHTLMLVPQGFDYETWHACLVSMCDLARTLAVPRYVIGIGKHMHARVAGGRRTLVSVCQTYRLTCHLLGASNDPLEDIRLLNKDVVRGLDTSLPFAVAQAGYGLLADPKDEEWSVPRFEGRRAPLDFLGPSGLVGRRNMENYLGWVKSGRRAASHS